MLTQRDHHAVSFGGAVRNHQMLARACSALAREACDAGLFGDAVEYQAAAARNACEARRLLRVED